LPLLVSKYQADIAFPRLANQIADYLSLSLPAKFGYIIGRMVSFMIKKKGDPEVSLFSDVE